MREFFTIAIFKIKADIRMNKTTLNSQKEKHSTLSLRRATRPGQRLQSVTGFLSTLSLRRATFQGPGLVRHGVDFYPRSPCGERLRHWTTYLNCSRFLSTLSLRRATSQQPDGTTKTTYFYPRSPCGERHSTNANLRSHRNFYPRSPCGERHILCVVSVQVGGFLSTLSLRRATTCIRDTALLSIHFYPRSPCGERPSAF